jgi:release factor glutamine methyltransferase
VSAPGSELRRADAERTGVWTVLDLLRWTTGHLAERGIESARLDAECLLAHALGVERLRLYIDFDKPVDGAGRDAFRALVRRRAGERVPVAQLVGRKEFWSMSLRVTRDVLAPRPETETLVAAALDLLPGPESRARVLDLGTGSGAVALALAREHPSAVITATDLSQEALKTAQQNAEELGMAARIRFLRGHLFEPVRNETFDLVVSNPPYLAQSARPSMAPELAHEPEEALFAGPDGLALLRPLVAQAGAVLSRGAGFAVEIDPGQAGVVTQLCERAGFVGIRLRRDLAGRARVISARRPGEPTPAD